MPEISEAALSEVFSLARAHRATPQGGQDLAGVTAMLGKFSGDLPGLIGPAREQYARREVADIQEILCASFRCATLTPGDFNRQVFEDLIGFQSLLHTCGAAGLDAAVRLSVIARRDYKDATTEDKESAAALVFVRIYPPQKYNDSYLDIAQDAALGMPSQNWTAKNIVFPADEPAAPAKLMKPLQLRAGKMSA